MGVVGGGAQTWKNVWARRVGTVRVFGGLGGGQNFAAFSSFPVFFFFCFFNFFFFSIFQFFRRFVFVVGALSTPKCMQNTQMWGFSRHLVKPRRPPKVAGVSQDVQRSQMSKIWNPPKKINGNPRNSGAHPRKSTRIHQNLDSLNEILWKCAENHEIPC